MEHEFIPYEQALALKELGYNEPCFAYYGEINGGEIELFFKKEFDCDENGVLAPLYQQTFRWFREKGIESEIKKIDEGYTFHCFRNQQELVESISKLFNDNRQDFCYKTYEEAEFECLKKLIEIVKANGEIKTT